jgi:GDP-L-fucose synthase
VTDPTQAGDIAPLDRAFDLRGRRVWVAGHRGLVGSACVRRLEREPCEILTAGRERVDLTRQAEVEAFLEAERPDVVILAAAKVGGVLANDTRPGEFLHENLAIQTNVLEAARRAGVTKLLFLGSSCIYPREAPQPMPEECLLTGPLEPTNQWYAIAKIAGVKQCQAYRRQYGCDFIAAMPTNLYGPHDNFDPTQSHVIPGLIQRMHAARQRGDRSVAIWGSGRPRREFLHADDLADALVHLLRHYSGATAINVGTGTDVAIAELAELIRQTVGFQGELVYDPEKPDGSPRKLLDITRLNALGWRASIPLALGLADTYAWFAEHVAAGRARTRS